MIEKVILNPDNEKKPAIIQWDEQSGEYIVDTPDGLTVSQLYLFLEEVKRITDFEC